MLSAFSVTVMVPGALTAFLLVTKILEFSPAISPIICEGSSVSPVLVTVHLKSPSLKITSRYSYCAVNPRSVSTPASSDADAAENATVSGQRNSISVLPTTSPLYTISSFSTPSLSASPVNTTLSEAASESWPDTLSSSPSAMRHSTSSGISTGKPAVSAPIAEKSTVEPGV